MNLETVAYNPKTGHLHSFDSSKPYGPHLTFIATDARIVIDAFCWWCSEINDLSNQPDKSWDYVGKKPASSKIAADFRHFLSAYKFIEVSRKCNPTPIKLKQLI